MLPSSDAITHDHGWHRDLGSKDFSKKQVAASEQRAAHCSLQLVVWSQLRFMGGFLKGEGTSVGVGNVAWRTTTKTAEQD